MKIFVALSLLFAVASAGVLPAAVTASENPEIQEIVAAIQSPSTDPATAAALEQMLLDVLGLSKPEPIEVGPAIVDNYEPISIGPAIVDNYEPISIGPAIVDNYEPIAIGPAIVDNYEPISIGPAIVDNYEPISIGPAIVDFPLPDGGAVTDVEPSPAMPSPSSSPLVQIIIKINQALADAIGGSPVVVESVNPPAPTPVQVIDAPQIPDQVVVVDKPVVAEPVIAVDKPVVAEPVIVVDKPEVPEGVIVVDKPIVADPVIAVEKPEAPESVVVVEPIIPAPDVNHPHVIIN